MHKNRIWYITGASKGMGFALAKQLLIKGHSVAATSRNLHALEALKMYGKPFLPLQVDLSNEQSIQGSVSKTVEYFGGLDIVVNNAGYGLGGALEELTEAEINDNFDINFFAVVRVIKQVLPIFRKQKSGHIINISSIAGFAPGAGWNLYSAAKAALTGLSEGLANDLKPLSVNVTNVLPGWFRTNFAKEDSIAYGLSEIEDYAHLQDSFKKMESMDGKQPGDPEKMAAVFLELVASSQPPVNLFLGSDAFARAKAKIEQLTAEMDKWKTVSGSTDFSTH